MAANDSYNTNEDTLLTVAAAGVLANDSDVDGDGLHAVVASGTTHGDDAERGDGSFTYTPAANYYGADSFSYKAPDAALDSNVATVSIVVNPVNDAPVAANDSYSTNEDTQLTVEIAASVLGNDSDVDGDSLHAVLVSSPSHGTLVLNANGSFTYAPAANYNGTDSFTYKASDGMASSNVATVTITVTAVNDAPTAQNQSVSVTYGSSIAITLGAQDQENDPADVPNRQRSEPRKLERRRPEPHLHAGGGLQRPGQLHVRGQRRPGRQQRRDGEHHGRERERRTDGVQPDGHTAGGHVPIHHVDGPRRGPG